MFETICKKCEYGDDIKQLNEHERVFFVTQILEQEVNNGGFSQFFYNSSGDFANELIDSFIKIGAFQTAEICKKALTIFNGKVLTDRDEREKQLDRLNCEDLLNECDDAFYNYEENLEALNYDYIMKYQEFFH
ncbi:MAG: DMP19 family protein [Erysipelotrichaceae bacterium]|nr:DMP19 family protein [Erysipelotrichaceae bacterium]